MFRILFFTTFSLYMAFTPSDAKALSLQIERGAFGDVVRLSDLDSNQSIQSTRISPTGLYVSVSNFNRGNFQYPNAGTSLIRNVEPSGAGFVVNLANPNFGFIQSQNNSDIIINLYPDSLGSRWRPSPQSQALQNEVQNKSNQALNSASGTATEPETPPVSNTVQTQAPIPSVAQTQTPVTQAVQEPKTTPSLITFPSEQNEQNEENKNAQNQTANRSNVQEPTRTNIQNPEPAQQVRSSVSEPLTNNQEVQSLDSIDASTTEEIEEPTAQSSNAQEPIVGTTTQRGRNSFTFSLSDQNIDSAKPASEEELAEYNKRGGTEESEAQAPGEEGATDTEKAAEEPVEETEPEPVGEIVYMDEAGNIVPAPIDISKTLRELNEAVELGEFNTALEKADLLKDKQIPLSMLEQVLFARLLALFDINYGSGGRLSEDIIGAAQELVNANPNHPEMPKVLEILVDTYLELDRTQEAEAYVNRLLDVFPNTDETPTAMLLLSNHFMTKGEYAKASVYLEKIINNYPDDNFSQSAALMQTTALYKQGDLERTKAFIDFMDSRWDRLYLDNPEYLSIKGEVEEILEDNQSAIETYWLMYNVEPMGKSADFALDNLAKLYFVENEPEAAGKVLDTLIKDFPESPLRPDALMMKAENGEYPIPTTLQDIYSLYDKPNPVLPEIYYRKIVEEYPDTEEARFAELKLAAGALWSDDYILAADSARDFYAKYIDTKEADIALDILHQAVDPIMKLALEENNYEQVLSLIEDYPQVQKSYEPYSQQLRMAIARALINRKQNDEAEEILDSFLQAKPENEQDLANGIYAYNIMLLNALAKQDWSRVLDVTAKLDGWDLPKDLGLQRLYSTALAAENLNLPARSLPIWKALAPNEEVPLYQRAYAQYFLARDAERRQNLRDSYQANLDALAMFEDLKNQQSPYADSERVRESIAALMDITEIAGRFAESMEWLNRYRQFVPQNSPDYAGVQLREARLSKKMGDNARWKAILEQVREREPDSVFGRMADSELKAFDIARDINRFAGQN